MAAVDLPALPAPLVTTWDALRPTTGRGFRPREACEMAAALFEPAEVQRWRAEEEQARLTWRLHVSPGVLRLEQRRPDTPVKLRAKVEPQRTMGLRCTASVQVAAVAGVVNDYTSGEEDELGNDRCRPEFWSPRSRLRMMRRLASLDWRPVVATEDELFDETGRFVAGIPALVTLTYPKCWETCAPSAKVAKQQLDRFFRRWDRACGPFAGVWKLEFQRRGAPHFHIFARVPMMVEHKVGRGRGARFVAEPFTTWLSRTWFEVVGSHDVKHLRAGTGVDYSEGLRCSDPRRLAAYFAGYAAVKDKAYQHRCPDAWTEGAGRWWGVRRLETVTATVELDQAQFIELRRLCRGWVRGQGRRPVRALASGRLTGATVLANDAPAMVAALARAVGPPGARMCA